MKPYTITLTTGTDVSCDDVLTEAGGVWAYFNAPNGTSRTRIFYPMWKVEAVEWLSFAEQVRLEQSNLEDSLEDERRELIEKASA